MTASIAAGPPLVELAGVSKEYAGGVRALDDANLTVTAGELLAIVGRSGSGKSTMLNLIGTLDRPSRGRVSIDGHDVAALTDRELSALRAGRIGFVFQQFHLPPGAPAVDAVADGLLYRGVSPAERRRRAAAALRRVGLGHRLDHRPHELSGGERQRVAIARAVLGEPALLLADEPTGNLDTASGEEVLAVLKELHVAGTAVVVITHDREVAERMPRRVRMRDGRIVEDTRIDARAASGPTVPGDDRCDARPLMGGGVERTTPARPAPARMRPSDVLRVGVVELRTRRLRTFLSALGIAIGIAAMVSVVGISTSSRAEIERTLAALGTNLLTVTPGDTLFGKDAKLPTESASMIGRIGSVQRVSSAGTVLGVSVYRHDRIPRGETGGIGVRAAELDLPDAIGATTARGTWLNAATERYPAVVLGAAAARRLGIGSTGADMRVFLGGRWFTVVGVLDPVPLAPEIDSSALVGWPAAVTYLGFDGHPTTIYTRSVESAVESVRSVLAATANPAAPYEVKVSRPSDALAAQRAADAAFTGLLLGIGAVALLVGGVGVANTMVISVLERRAEIGLRRSLGATRGQVRTQFLAESLLLSALGGAAGVLLGIAVTAGYALIRSWPVVVPAWATGGGITATVLIGALAGLYPAVRAARLAPTEALANP